MYFSENYKSQWWVPPRTGSRMLKKILDRLDFKSEGHHEMTIKDPNWDLNILIRNPYSRAVSYWLNRNEKRYNTDNFMDFSESIHNKQDYLRDLHVSNFKDPSREIISKKIKYYTLIKYETLFEDILMVPYIKDNLHLLQQEISFFNLGHTPWRLDRPKELIRPYYEFYNQDLADIVYTQKQSEFELGGYHRDSWKTLVK